MRLVDADEVYKVLTDYYHHRTEIQHKALKEAIQRVSTIDPVKHGRWNEEMGGGYICSLCERFSDFATNYCPHYGAKMEIDEKRD